MAYTCKMCDAKCSGRFVTGSYEVLAYGQKGDKCYKQFCSKKCQSASSREGDLNCLIDNIDDTNDFIDELEKEVRDGIPKGEDVSELVSIIRSQKTYVKFVTSVMTHEMTNAEIKAGAFNARDILNTASEKVLEGSNDEPTYDDLIQSIAVMTSVIDGCWDYWACD
jgi:hypothetical protein